jgi:hypothetical protein
LNNSEKYHFNDFTTENYRQLIRLAKKNYTFRGFYDFNPEERFILWRHDIDFSVHRAAKLAQVEFEEGIRSTYYLLLHSEFYNLLEKEITDLVFNIIRAGHDIGLHFDAGYYNIQNEDLLEQKLNDERNLIQSVFNVPVKSFCFHITNDFTLSCNKPEYAGLVNAFSEFFQKQIPYCSDSNGYWRYRRLEDVLAKAEDKNLQVLTHPGLWQDEVMSPKQRVYRSADLRSEKMKKWYDDVLKKNGRENIDWK